MRIAVVHQPLGGIHIPVREGSIAIWTYEVARRLARCSDVTVYALRGPGQKEVEVRQGVRYRRVTATLDNHVLDLLERHPRLKRFPGFRKAERPFFASGLAHWEYGLKVAADVRRQRCDYVHVQNFSQFIPGIRAWNPTTKVIVHMQCEWLTQLERSMIRRRLQNCDLIIGCSQYIAHKIRGAFPQLAARCRVIYNGVDVVEFVPRDDSSTSNSGVKRLLFVGRVSPEKGLHILLEAFKTVIRHYPQAELQIVGPESIAPAEFILNLSDDQKVLDLARFYRGSYLAQLRQMLSPEIAKRVSFLGNFAYPQLPEFYRRADVFICPSVWNDPSPLTIGEAMSSGVPVVATNGGGLPELVVEGETGLLVERGDAPALAEAVLHLLGNESLRRSMAKAGRERALRLFSWDKIAQDVLEHYQELMEEEELAYYEPRAAHG